MSSGVEVNVSSGVYLPETLPKPLPAKGQSIARIPQWDPGGTPVEPGWNPGGTWVEPGWNP